MSIEMGSKDVGIAAQLIEGPLRRTGLLALLLIGIAVLTLTSLITNALWLQGFPRSDEMRALLCVDEEMSIPTWWSGITLAVLGGLAWVTGQTRGTQSQRSGFAWRALGVGFVLLSIDESCKLHERFGSLIDMDGSLTHARWIVLWVPLGVIAASVIFWLLWRSSQRAVIGLVLGAVVFLSGAVGVETLNAVNRHRAETRATQILESGTALSDEPIDRTGKRNTAYVVGTAFEELLEMLGVVVWFGVLWRIREEGAPLIDSRPFASRRAPRGRIGLNSVPVR